jgi:hypothetical protein
MQRARNTVLVRQRQDAPARLGMVQAKDNVLFRRGAVRREGILQVLLDAGGVDLGMQAHAAAADQPDTARDLIAGQADAPANAFAQLGLGRLDLFAEAAPAGIGKQPAGHLGELSVRCGAGQAHRRCVPANVVLDVPADPADGIVGESAVEPLGVEARDRGMQAEMAGTDQVGEFDIRLPVSAGDGNHELAVAFPQVDQRSLPRAYVGRLPADAEQVPLPIGGQVGSIELRTNGRVVPAARTCNRHSALPARSDPTYSQARSLPGTIASPAYRRQPRVFPRAGRSLSRPGNHRASPTWVNAIMRNYNVAAISLTSSVVVKITFIRRYSDIARNAREARAHAASHAA